MRNTLLILFFGSLTLSACGGVFFVLSQITRSLKTIMGKQADFDAQVAGINSKLDAISEQVTAEAQQIRDFIEANPTINTEALQGVAARLDSLDTSVGDIFTPPDAGGDVVPAEGGTADPTEPTAENPNPTGEALDPDPTPAPLPNAPENTTPTTES